MSLQAKKVFFQDAAHLMYLFTKMIKGMYRKEKKGFYFSYKIKRKGHIQLSSKNKCKMGKLTQVLNERLRTEINKLF